MAKEGHSSRKWISHSFHLHIATFFYCCTHTLSVSGWELLKQTCTLWQILSLEVEMHDSLVMSPGASSLSVQCTKDHILRQVDDRYFFVQTLFLCGWWRKALPHEWNCQYAVHFEQPAGEPGMWWKSSHRSCLHCKFSPPCFNTIKGNAVRVGQNAK